MSKAIGPSFPDELKVAGLLGLPFAWGTDGVIQFDSRMTQPQMNAVLAVYAAHDPATPAAPTQDTLNVADLKAKIDTLVANVTIPQAVRDFATALKKTL